MTGERVQVNRPSSGARVCFWLAQVVMVLHLGVVAILVIGSGAVATGALFRGPLGWLAVYVAMWLGVLASQIIYRECVLTRWEKQLWERFRAGSAHRSSFLRNYFPVLSFIVNRYGIIVIALAGLVGLAIRLGHLMRALPLQ